ncbi:MAG: ATP-binding protein [Candidatus Eisenbacteria bacterium]
MSHTDIMEALALVGNLRNLAQEVDLGVPEKEVEARRRLLAITDEISRRLAELDRPSSGESPEGDDRRIEEGRLAALGRVTAEVGHQMNNLLAILATRMELADLCLQEGDSERALSNFRLARDYLHQVETLAVRLMNFSGAPARPQRSDLNEIVRATIGFARLLDSYENIDFETELAGDIPQLIVDPARWQQLLLSLIANAADAVGRRKGEGGRIRVDTKHLSAESRIALTVRDEGRGIAAENLPHVFEPGFTTEGCSREGLGLATCRRIVEEAGASIDIESEWGRGTTVTISIPIPTLR